MSYRNMLFLLVGVLYVGCFAAPVAAVPTVKKLGMTNNASVQNISGSLQKSSKSSDSSRPSSVRLGVANSKPLTAGKVKQNNTVKSGVENDASKRLTVGKYIHTSGVNSGYIKPIASTSDIQAQSDEILDLTDRVVQLEKQMETKQEALYASDGIEIAGNTIKLTEELEQLPDALDDINEQLQEKADIANISSNYYTKGETEQYVQQIVSQLSPNNVNYVNQFNPCFLHPNQQECQEQP